MTNAYSIWVKLDRYPPVLVRLLAKSGPQTLKTDKEIAASSRGALSISDIKQLSYLPSWDEVSVSKMRAFCLACGVDFADRAVMRKLNRYMKQPTFAHLKRSTLLPEIKAMLTEYYNYEQSRL